MRTSVAMAWLPNNRTIHALRKTHHVQFFRWWQFDNCRQMSQLVSKAFKTDLMRITDERSAGVLNDFFRSETTIHQLSKQTQEPMMKIIIGAQQLAWSDNFTEVLEVTFWWSIKCPWHCTNDKVKGNPLLQSGITDYLIPGSYRNTFFPSTPHIHQVKFSV